MIKSRNENYARILSTLLHMFYEMESVFSGHLNIQKNQVRFFKAQDFNGFIHISGKSTNFHAFSFPKDVFEKLPGLRLIIHY